MKRVAMYLRQSSDRADTQLGIERQRGDVMRLLQSRGWEAAETFVDNDVSATSRKPRPEFNRMMAGVDEGRFDVIVSRHIDRLLRRLAELEDVLARCETHSVAIVTASDGVDTSTDGGRLVARILASVGQGEVERKSARQRSAVVQAAQQGRWVGGRRAFGYEGDGVTIREVEAAIIRQGYADILAGESQEQVARNFRASGLPTTQGNAWTRSAVSDVLGNPRMAGLRRHRPAAEVSQLRTRPADGIVGKAEWPGIVDEDTWRAAVRVMYPLERHGRVTAPVGLLTGVAVCGMCGMFVHMGARSRGTPAYRCKSGKHVSRRAEPINEFVSALAIERLSQTDALQLFAPKVEANTRDLSSEADTLRRRLTAVAEDYADGVLTRGQVQTVNARIRERLEVIETAMTAAAAGNVVAEVVQSGDVAGTWGTLSLARRRGVIDSLMVPTLHPIGKGRRQFNPDSIGIEWRT